MTRAAALLRSGGSGAQPRLDRNDIAALSVLVLALGTLWFGLFNHDFSVNGLRYADDVERGIELFHPNHLLPNLLYRGAYLFVQTLGGAGLRAIWLMQALNICAGLIVAGAVARIVLASGGDRTRAVLLGALYGVGFAAWNFAEEPDVYILPAAAVALSMAVLAGRSRLGWRAVGALAALATFAVLTLQQYVFWYPALLALVAARDLGASRRAKLSLLAIGVPLACLVAYLVAGAVQGRLHGVDEALGWFLGYAWSGQGGLATYRPAPHLLPRLLGTVLGLGNLAVAYEVILSRATAVAAAAACAALLLVAIQTARGFGKAPAVRRDAAIIALWCAANLAFATWWESRNIEFLFPVWVGAAALAALAAPRLDRRLLAFAVVLVGAVNLAAAFWPQHDWPQRYRVADALARQEHLGGTDVLVTEELNTIGYLHYFTATDVQFQPGAVSAAMHASMPVAQARAAIDAALARGARVYTTELDERGRLRAIARWFAPLGRDGFDGAVDRDIAALYQGLDLSAQPVPGAHRVAPAVTPR